MDFLITYEHKAREIESVVLLKTILERKGYSVVLYPWYGETKEILSAIKKDPPKVFVVSATYNEDNFRTFVNRVCGFQKKVINLRWEQVFTVEDENIPLDIKLPAFYPSGVVKEIVHVCWGEEEQRQLIERGVKEEKAALVGHLGMDFLRPEFRGLMYTKEKLSQIYKIDLTKRWALFISSFTIFEFDKRTQEEHKMLTGDLGVEDVFIRACIETRKILLEWFDRALQEHKDTIIIYRPHPNESKMPTELNYLEKKYENFKVIPDMSVKQWIYCSDIVYNWFSTSFADIAFLGKEAILLRPYYIEKQYDYKVLSIQPQIHTYDEFLKSLRIEKKSNKETKSEYMQLIHEYYANSMDAEPAYQKVLELFEKVYNSDELNVNYSLRYIIETEFIFFVQKIKKIFINIILQNGFLQKYVFNKWYIKYIESLEFTEDRIKKGKKRNIASNEEIESLQKQIECIMSHGFTTV